MSGSGSASRPEYLDDFFKLAVRGIRGDVRFSWTDRPECLARVRARICWTVSVAAEQHHELAAAQLFETFCDLIADQQFVGRSLLLDELQIRKPRTINTAAPPSSWPIVLRILSRRCSPARSSTTSGCRPCWSRSRRSRPLIRRISSEGTWRGSDRRTTSRRRVCRRRAGSHATVLPRLRPEAAHRMEADRRSPGSRLRMPARRGALAVSR